MVTVNGRPWNQIVAHVSDDEPATRGLDASGSSGSSGDNEALSSRVVDKMLEQMTRDRAVVGIFGLEPGKQYEIDLKVVANFAGEGEPLQAGTFVDAPRVRQPAELYYSHCQYRDPRSPLDANGYAVQSKLASESWNPITIQLSASTSSGDRQSNSIRSGSGTSPKSLEGPS